MITYKIENWHKAEEILKATLCGAIFFIYFFKRKNSQFKEKVA